jgi:hypothetical protein
MPGTQSQGLRESPAISVLIVRKIQHTQIGPGGSVCSIPPHEKWHFLVDMDFLVKEITNSASNFT